ncbi:beta-phosphoglucomutase [Nodularia spumigena CS-591/04]|uniref:beta-phosphoglucomutase n=1 Tax=Nodularia spumigena TaxID=70799 RepID=UPI00232F2B44|nr:beta-phosphoglucomutase [Nodularia spumigena]MDB9322052.1 beta-phosphoglucomutase [Nodularia spumigena CS-591/07A]MDB9331077.1 beta-phosphoglucomutase [Nodularia spumigena CS-591/04]MDB9362157.1 beta-phosphoglucomutase [Nodularia spumigena CS-588/02]MDB9365175.1 beta-phosphoglucomutase [Nodularia spumigena CS-588/02A10]
MNKNSPNNHFIYTDWILIETQFDPEQLHSRETVFTIGNGYLGTRGSFEEGYIRALPATFIHGVYDDVPVVYTELANCPDWLPLVISINGDKFRFDQGEILRYDRQLDLRQGILSRSVRWCSPSGKTVDIHFERFASLADQHVLGQRCQVTPVDFDGMIEIQVSINGYPENQGFNHWEAIDQGKTAAGIWLHSRTRGSRIDIGMAARVAISGTETALQVHTAPGYPTITATFLATSQQTVTVEKTVTVFTSRDVSQPVPAAQAKLAQLPNYITLLQANAQAWNEVWHYSDILIEGDSKAAFAVRYNLFQLLISAPKHDEKVSIPAKTLSGFGYRGHIFWDTEIFILPFFIFTQPALARNLLSYRYHTLNGARRKASHYGYKGAMYAWESAVTGDEVTPRWSLPSDFYGEDIRIWCRDHEIHISSDISYAVWYYWQATGDDEWMQKCGAEIILDTAIFWNSRVEFNSEQDRYEIRGVIGADEYHEFVHNNTFTNRIVQWHLEKALIVDDWLHQTFPEQAQELEQKLQLTAEIKTQWSDIVAKIWIPYDAETGLIEQFEGFFQLEDINWNDYEPRTQSMQGILGIEKTNKLQVLKQPDVLMLLYLMRELGDFPYNQKSLQANWDYYAPRTDITYGSSLGPAIHAILASDLGKSADAYERFMQAAIVDLEDVRGNAADGIHGANAGGIWQAVVFGFGGIKLRNSRPVANPHLPRGWTRLKFKLHWRGKWHEFDLRPQITQEESNKGFILFAPSSSQTSQIQGVIFDLDGVLTDTAEYHYQAWQKLADEEGIEFNRQDNEALRGISRRASLMLMIKNRKFSEAQIQEMLERKNRYYVDLILNITPKDVLPGAIALLNELREKGIKIAIGSASKNAQVVVERLGIADHVDAIADGYSVQQPKPAPDLFLYAAKQLGVPPEQCLVFEDAAAGVEAALAAGMWVVGLGPSERVGAAHVVLPSLAGVRWAELQNKLREAMAQKY